jgi:hypothetical protein
MKKILCLCLLSAATLLAKAQSDEKLDYYFFIEADLDYGNPESHTFYISSIIYYQGYDECGADYDFKRKAERAFQAYLEAKYDVKRLRIGRTFATKVNSTDKLKTRQQAEEKMNSYIADEKKRDYTVRKTNFSYSCE